MVNTNVVRRCEQKIDRNQLVRGTLHDGTQYPFIVPQLVEDELDAVGWHAESSCTKLRRCRLPRRSMQRRRCEVRMDITLSNRAQ